jgi:hypothetical protein
MYGFSKWTEDSTKGNVIYKYRLEHARKVVFVNVTRRKKVYF